MFPALGIFPEQIPGTENMPRINTGHNFSHSDVLGISGGHNTYAGAQEQGIMIMLGTYAGYLSRVINHNIMPITSAQRNMLHAEHKCRA